MAAAIAVAVADRYAAGGAVSDTYFPTRCTRYTLMVFGPLLALGVGLLAARLRLGWALHSGPLGGPLRVGSGRWQAAEKRTSYELNVLEEQMPARKADGSAGDADYGAIGAGYSNFRRPDPRIAAVIRAALGNVASVLNVGAGAGSYEPDDIQVTAVEPSATMRAQRPFHLSAAIDAYAEALPFEDDSFDAAMALVTVHQWSDLVTGLREMRRVTRGPVVVMTADPAALRRFWLSRYAPEVIAVEAGRMPPLEQLLEALGGQGDILTVPIPFDCRDGFNDAYYGRPERLLDPAARQACSSWSFVESAAVERFEAALAADLTSGAWDAKWGRLRTMSEYNGSLRLVVSRPF